MKDSRKEVGEPETDETFRILGSDCEESIDIDTIIKNHEILLNCGLGSMMTRSPVLVTERVGTLTDD